MLGSLSGILAVSAFIFGLIGMLTENLNVAYITLGLQLISVFGCILCFILWVASL